MGSFVNVKQDGLVQHARKILMNVLIRLYLVLFVKMAANVKTDHHRLDFLAIVHRNIMGIHAHKSIMTVHKVNAVARGHAWIKIELNMVLKLMNASVSLALNYHQMGLLVLILMNVSQVHAIQVYNVKILMVHTNVKAVQLV